MYMYIFSLYIYIFRYRYTYVYACIQQICNLAFSIAWQAQLERAEGETATLLGAAERLEQRVRAAEDARAAALRTASQATVYTHTHMLYIQMYMNT